MLAEMARKRAELECARGEEAQRLREGVDVARPAQPRERT
jgi:hypothetical protein